MSPGYVRIRPNLGAVVESEDVAAAWRGLDTSKWRLIVEAAGLHVKILPSRSGAKGFTKSPIEVD